jgi:hypothetical protein
MRSFIGKQIIFDRKALELQRGTSIPCEGCYADKVNPDDPICPILSQGRRDCLDIYRAVWVKVEPKQSIAQCSKRVNLL